MPRGRGFRGAAAAAAGLGELRCPHGGSFEPRRLAQVEAEYATSLKVVHWVMGTGVIGCIASVQFAMDTTKERKPYARPSGIRMRL